MPYAKKRRTGMESGVRIPVSSKRTIRRKVPIRLRRKSSSRKRNMRNRRAASKAIKKVVEKVIACKDNVGIYRKSYGGDIRSDVSLGTKTVAFYGQRLQGNTSPYLPFSLAWTPYNLKRVLDAASVLYNNKTKSIAGPELLGTENNNFNPIGLKVDLLYASYHLAVTNMTNTQYYLEIIEFTNKFNGDRHAMEVIKELLLGTNWVGGVPLFASPDPVNGIFRLECDLDFGMIKGVSSRYAVKSFGKKLVKPGDTINYFTKDKMCVDFQKKLYTENTAETPDIPSFAKGEKQVIIVMMPVVGIVDNGTNNTIACHTVANDSSHGFVYKVEEVFKLMEPDATLDEYQGDKRCFLSDYGEPASGTLVRNERDYGPTSTNFASLV